MRKKSVFGSITNMFYFSHVKDVSVDHKPDSSSFLLTAQHDRNRIEFYEFQQYYHGRDLQKFTLISQ